MSDVICPHNLSQRICPRCNPVEVEIIESKVDQPRPSFTLVDLEAKLAAIYLRNMNLAKFQSASLAPEYLEGLKEANGMIQELVAIVDQHKRDLMAIDMPVTENKIVQQHLQTNKPEFHVSGVQLIEEGKLVGTSLYSTIVKARNIRDTLNREFARLKVNHEAKIINYPVF